MAERTLDVLLVEDDPVLAGMYRVKLESDGHRVAIAADGLVGLRMALEHIPSVLLLDIRLPGIDGLELLARLRQDEAGASLPVIVLSNYDDDDVVSRGTLMGTLAHLVKSQTTPGCLARAIRELVPSGPAR